MLNKHNLPITILLSLSFSVSASAANISLNGTVSRTIPIYQDTTMRGIASMPTEKIVTFERIELSPAAKQYLASHIGAQQPTPKLLASPLPVAVKLEMNGVPVLDQGMHGACVTFATIAAIDAAQGEREKLESSDQYSQLCSLELGATLEAASPTNEKGEHLYPSGWDGSWGFIVLNQIEQYGLISKLYQETKGCAGVREYPLRNEKDTGKAMSVKDYTMHSDKIMPAITYKILLKPNDAFSSKVNTNELLTNIKTALTKGNRVTFGTLLDTNLNIVGALGTYKVKEDTWILTPEVIQDAKEDKIKDGHEMIIIGYDDNAEAIGPNKEKHKGLLILRNSWGKEAGDKGNYYMSYDHFKALVMEAIEIKIAN